MTAPPQILVVDDDREIRDLISRYLRKNGFRVEVAADGAEMRQRLASARVDLVVLDRVMPGEDGLSLCREMRARGRIPVIMLTLLNTDLDRILGLEMGADDYLSKPFNPQELVARIRAVLRRVHDLPPGSTIQGLPVLRFNGWTLEKSARRLTSPDGVVLKLTDGEFDLLVVFAERPQIVLSRDQLLELSTGRESMAFDRSIDMQLMRLRRKIETNPNEPDLIKTIRNRGYVFTPATDK